MGFTLNWIALWDSTPPIPLHAIAALVAVLLGGLQFALPNGGLRHRVLGWAYVILMAAVALSALFIHTIKLVGIWSPIHLLIPLVLFSLWRAIRSARQRNFRAHKRTMTSLFILALLITGGFTLLPGRIMHAVLFGG